MKVYKSKLQQLQEVNEQIAKLIAENLALSVEADYEAIGVIKAALADPTNGDKNFAAVIAFDAINTFDWYVEAAEQETFDDVVQMRLEDYQDEITEQQIQQFIDVYFRFYEDQKR